MQITVNTEILTRLARVSVELAPTDERNWLRSVFVERRNGHAFAGATNSIFAAMQYLGVSPGDDGFVVVPTNRIEKTENTEISAFPLVNWFTVNGNQFQPENEAFETLSRWRNWFPSEEATQPGKSMFIDVDGLQSLVSSSPSGNVVFPRIIDSEKPIIVRDCADSNWIGLFLARPSNGLFLDGATRPEWSR